MPPKAQWGEYENAVPLERLDLATSSTDGPLATAVQQAVVAHRGGPALGHVRERFSHVHGSVLAHPKHLRGTGATTRRPAKNLTWLNLVRSSGCVDGVEGVRGGRRVAGRRR